MKRILLSASALMAAVALGAPAHALDTNLIQNGNFALNDLADTDTGVSDTFRLDPSDSIADWTYNVPGGPTANNGGLMTVLVAANLNSDHNMNDTCCDLGFWGSSNGGVSTITAPPSGDTFVLAQDSAPENTAYLSQTINGLTEGKTYSLTFEYAGAQLYGFGGTMWNGATNEGVEVNLGGTYDTSAPGGTQSQAYTGGQTDVVYYDGYADSIPSHGFSGWQAVRMLFTATSVSEVLNLETISTSSGEPPFALVDDLQMFAVPEPATWTMMILGIGALGVLARRRRGLAAVAA